jgi:hypothetical protein
VLIRGFFEVRDAIRVDVPITIIGGSPRPVIAARNMLVTERGILTTGSDVQIKNLEFRFARAVTGNAAGVWHNSGHLVLESCSFIRNQNGVMAAECEDATLTVSKCEFIRNGGGCGHTHALDVNRIACLHVAASSFTGTVVGHHLKTRCGKSLIEQSLFHGEPTDTTSYAIDLPNGGDAAVRSSYFVKPRDSLNPIFISFGSEGLTFGSNQLVVDSNMFTNMRPGWAVGVRNARLRGRVTGANNAFEDVRVRLLGRGSLGPVRRPRTAVALGVFAMGTQNSE